MMSEDKRPFVMIGTSGSHDYLRDTSGDRRYWGVREPSTVSGKPLSLEARSLIDRLVAASSGFVEPKLIATDEEAVCDGVHDASASLQYLCTRCFPDLRRDLVVDEYEVDENDDRRQNQDQEQEVE